MDGRDPVAAVSTPALLLRSVPGVAYLSGGMTYAPPSTPPPWDPGTDPARQKSAGAFYTPDAVVRSLVAWAVRRPSDRLLDPSCGDGRFLGVHPRSVGVEQEPDACSVVHARVRGSLIHHGEVDSQAAATNERTKCAARNPSFIRYQRFTGCARAAALGILANNGTPRVIVKESVCGPDHMEQRCDTWPAAVSVR